MSERELVRVWNSGFVTWFCPLVSARGYLQFRYIADLQLISVTEGTRLAVVESSPFVWINFIQACSPLLLITFVLNANLVFQTLIKRTYFFFVSKKVNVFLYRNKRRATVYLQFKFLNKRILEFLLRFTFFLTYRDLDVGVPVEISLYSHRNVKFLNL